MQVFLILIQNSLSVGANDSFYVAFALRNRSHPLSRFSHGIPLVYRSVELKRNQRRATTEYTVIDFLYARRQRKLIQILTLRECVLRNYLHTLRNNDFCQVGAKVKRAPADRFHASRDDDILQAGARVECIISDRRYALRNRESR